MGVDPNLVCNRFATNPYNTWFQAICAFHHELGKNEGYELAKKWSIRKQPNGYNQEELDLIWGSIEKIRLLKETCSTCPIISTSNTDYANAMKDMMEEVNVFLKQCEFIELGKD